jgi:hypothetical protein
MSVSSAFDLRRVRLVLRDLLKSTQGSAPMLELSPSVESTPRLRGVANRSGLLRLGLRLALAAIEEDPAISVDSEGRVNPAGAPGVIDIVLTEESELPTPRKKGSDIFVFVVPVIVMTILALAVVGLATTLRWIGML